MYWDQNSMAFSIENKMEIEFALLEVTFTHAN